MTFTLVGDREATRIDAGLVTGNYCDVMGLSPELGRAFGPGDDGPGAAPVMMLTYDYWKTKFNGDSTIVGKQLRVAAKAVTVVGVLQATPFKAGGLDAAAMPVTFTLFAQIWPRSRWS